MKKIFSIILAPLFTVHFASAQVVVNEFSASNLSQFEDNYQRYEDWIELYNTSASSVNIGGYFLSDNQNKPSKWQIPTGTTIAPNGYLVFWCSGRNESGGGNFHTSFKLKQTKGTEEIVLSNTDTIAINNIPLGLVQLGHSYCRSTNGGSTWKIDITPTPGNPNTAAGQHNEYAEKPEVSVIGGFYSAEVGIQMTNSPNNAMVHYTVNGTLPTTSSPVFSGLHVISSTQILKLRAFSNNPQILPSRVEFNTYFINESFTLPVFSVGADQLLTLANGDNSLRPHGSIEYFNANEQRTTISYGELNSHGQDSWVNFQRSLDWISRDEMGYSAHLADTLFDYSDRNTYQKIIFRASGDDNYPADNVPSDPSNVHDGGTHVRDEFVHTLVKQGGMKLDVRSVERCILYLNGEYWGVYAIRERCDEADYTKEYFDQDKYNLHYLKTWGYHWAEFGGQQAFDDWAVLRDFILNNDMGNAANYEQVAAQYNFRSIIDYMITNLNVVASDWLNYNTGWWRGLDPQGNHKKWGYIIWDMDATFDYYINYSGVPNTNPDAQPCDIEDIADFVSDPNQWQWWEGEDQGKHEQIFLKLLAESPDFEQLYYSRYADHMNTIFSCNNMLGTLDSMIATIAPEMPRHIQNWGGSMAEWEENVDELRAFIEERCSLLADGMVDCYDVTGPYELTIMVNPPNAGRIKLNTLWHEELPWTGAYFGNMDNLIRADNVSGGPNVIFNHWESTSGTVIFPHPDSSEAAVQLTGIDTLIAFFDIDYTSVKDLSQYIAFSAHPVPAINRLDVNISIPTAGSYDLALYSIQGKEVYRQTFSQQALRTSINTQSFARGMYVLSFESALGKKQVKIPLVE